MEANHFSQQLENRVLSKMTLSARANSLKRFIVDSGSNDAFIDSLAQSVQELWPIITRALSGNALQQVEKFKYIGVVFTTVMYRSRSVGVDSSRSLNEFPI